MTPDTSNWGACPEGQFFERKSAMDRSGGGTRNRKAADIARDIAETLAAMSNADGGELVVGIEDDGTVTGVPHPADKIRLLLGIPADRNYVSPPLRCRAEEVCDDTGHRLLHFVVDWSPEVHKSADGRYLLRIRDANAPFDAEQIAALKRTKAQGLFERSFPAGADLADLDLDIVAALRPRLGAGEPEEVLRRYRLIERRNGGSVPCLAGLLFFGKDPGRWHPRCGIDFIRWEGTERKHGPELNIAKRIRLEHPLAVLIEKAYEAIKPFIRERQHLHDLFFTERLEYPTFVWQEAIVNAVAHRDYSIQGASIEVWMFDDRMEVRSPGLPPQPVTVDALNRCEHVHLSRNPLMVRILTDLGYMRDAGEGIPRMFDEMEREGFYPPRIENVGDVSLQVTLRNQPVYDRQTLEWLTGFKDVQLTGDQKRILAFAHVHGDHFTSRDYQNLAGIGIYGAANSIKDLIRKGIVRSTKKGGRMYEVPAPLKARPEMPPELILLLPLLQAQRLVSNEDIRKTLGITRWASGRLARNLLEDGWLEREGTKRWTRYKLSRRGL